MKLVENNILMEISVEKQNWRESENKVTKLIDEKLFNLKLDLAKEKKLREEGEEKYATNVSEQIQ